MDRRIVLATALLAASVLLACSLPGAATPTPPGPAGDLIGVWIEARRIDADGSVSGPDDPLHIAFFSDRTFKAVFASHRFETFHDFWGNWATDGDTLTLTITNGNNLPQQSEYQGRFEVQEGELTLKGIVLVEDFAGPTTVFSYHGPEPKGRVVP
jgi:hypothetical protein